MWPYCDATTSEGSDVKKIQIWCQIQMSFSSELLHGLCLSTNVLKTIGISLMNITLELRATTLKDKIEERIDMTEEQEGEGEEVVSKQHA